MVNYPKYLDFQENSEIEIGKKFIRLTVES
jgi:hypothetical protein